MLAAILRREAVIAELRSRTRDDVLAELCAPLAAETGLESAVLVHALSEREKLGSTGVGHGVAIPHARLATLPALAMSFGRSRAGIDFAAIDGKPVYLFVALVAPMDGGGAHLKVLASIGALFKSEELRDSLLHAPDAAAIYRLLGGPTAA
jgi:nitrogen PTS system EIIA component